MRGTVGILEADAEVRRLIDLHGEELPAFVWKTFTTLGEALTWLREDVAEADVLLLGPGARDVVRAAERALSLRDGAEIVLCAAPERHAEVAAAARRSMFVGDAAPCVSLGDPASLVHALGEALSRAQLRARHRAVVTATEAKLERAGPVRAVQRSRHLEELWRSAPLGVVIVGMPDGALLDWNGRAAALLGLGPEAAGQPLGVFFGEEARIELDVLLGAPEERTSMAFTLPHGAMGETRIEVQIAGGSPDEGRLVLLHDVTARWIADEELRRRLAVIEAQQAEIAQLSAPIQEVWEGILSLPVMGRVDAARAARMTEALLEAVHRTRARSVIVDLTGVEALDGATADGLMSMVRATSLLGASCLMSGMTARVARAVMELGLDLQGLSTYPSLHAALRQAVRARR
jgi:anti-anti-sigma regulatory factor/PAS domain-containing protein